MSGSWRSYGVSKEVLLRNSFLCTIPGCGELAGDIHHVVPRKVGGTDESANLIGLCNKHHKWLHKKENTLSELHPVTHEWISPLTLAKYYLAEQLKQSPVRVSEIHQIDLFKEVEMSTASPEDFWRQWHPTYNRNYWSAYDVFLKAAWNHLRESRRHCSPLGVMVLYRQLWLYRRRCGRLNAAKYVARKLTRLLDELHDPAITWIRGKVEYELAYMDFMESPFDPSVVDRFEYSATLEKKAGNRSGALVSNATAVMTRLVAGNVPLFDDFLKTQDSLGGQDDPLATSWRELNLPYLMAVAKVISGKGGAIEMLAPMLPDSAGHSTTKIEEMEHLATWVAGVGLVQEGEVELGVRMLEHSRTIANRIFQAEGRAGLTVALGDGYWYLGRQPEAQAMWKLASREPPEFLNRRSQEVALSRLGQDIFPGRKGNRIHFLFDRRT